ncbi:hypothetical protein [Haloarcula salina]|uniref:PKD domain-containing protein n=1 Tax=Haloarcula salina TaxID=1429914 RepID=A0AA41KK96_9EURY|nr:hypothetical protein [Haloarcula salina]MBV0901659.1 hypothetical protein [Haloarcula salina]
MDFTGDERGQSVQIGAVLLFAVLILAFSSYQAFVVPEQNREVEFNHNQQVQFQLQDLRNAVVSQSGGGSLTAVSVTLGTNYPSRAVAVNPGPPSGSLRTNGTATDAVNLTVRNATVTGETGDFWNVTTQPGQGRVYSTGSIVYDPSYNVYTTPPQTVYDQTMLYNDFRTAQLTMANQSLVDGTQISLVTLNGSLDRASSGSVSVDVRPISSSTREVQIDAPDDDSPITLLLVTRRAPAQWEFLETTQSKVTAVEDAPTPAPPGYHTVLVKLDPGETYQLQMTKVGVGNRRTSEPVAYLTDIEGDGKTVSRGETTELVLEVRDAYNNPTVRESITVEGGVDGGSGGSLDRNEATINGDGRVTFEYQTSDSTPLGTNQLNFSIQGLDGTFDGSTPENVSMDVSVTDGGGGSDGGSGNSGLIYNEDAVAVASDGSTESGVRFTVTNEVGESIEITTVAIDPVDDDIDYLSDTVSNYLPPAPQRNELYIEADTDGHTDFGGGADIPRTVDVDDDGDLNGQNPVMSDTSSATFHLFEFERFGSRTDMSGESVTITVTYERASGGTGSKMFTVTPGGASESQRPNAEFTISSDGPQSNDKWDFDAGSSSDPQGDSLDYEWDLDGDGLFDDETGQTLQSEKVSSGTTVSLRVVDPAGNADTIRKDVP